MFSLRHQILILLGVALGSLLVAKTLVDLSRARPGVENAGRARAQVTLLQARALLEQTPVDGRDFALRRALRPLAETPDVRQVAVVRPDGMVLVSGRPEQERRAASGTALAPLLDLDLRSGGMRTSGDALLAASPVRLPVAAAPTPEGLPPTTTPVALLMEFDLTAPLGAARAAVLMENGIALAIVMVLLFVIGWLLESRIGRPARRMVSVIEQFDGGDRGARTGIRGPDEVGALARAFDAMADRQQAAEVHLLDTQRALDALLKALPVGVLVVKRDDGRPFYVNPAWRELFGIHLEVDRDILAILSTVRCERPDGSPYPLEELPITTVLRTGAAAEARDLCVRHDDRSVRLVAQAVPVSLAFSGGFDAVLVVAREAEPADLDVIPGHAPAPIPTAFEAAAAPAPPTRAGSGEASSLPTVLLADADPGTREQAAHALRQAGYRVLLAEDGAGALSQLRNEAPRIEAVVLDLGIEGPGGGSVLDDLLRLDPAARVIAASGYRPDLPGLAASGKVTAFMTRPYGPDRVVRAVQEAIGAAEQLERSFAP